MIAATCVAVNCAATASILTSITTITIADSSRTYPTLTNILGPLANLTTWQRFREYVCWILLACNTIQLQVTKSYASVSDVLPFHVFLQHSSLLNCRCRSLSEHRSSRLGSVIEFSSSCTLLESKRSPRLHMCLHLLTITSVFFFRANHRPNQSPYALATLLPTFVVHTSTNISCSSPGIDQTS